MPETQIFIRQTTTEYSNSLLNTVQVETVHFDPGDGTLPATEECLILSDEF